MKANSKIKERPRGARFGDPTAEAVWAAIMTLEPAAQMEIMGALSKRVAGADARPDSHQVRATEAVRALREAADLLGGKSPTVKEFRDLRVDHPELGWLADSTIRRVLGGNWNACLESAHLASVPEGGMLVVQLGSQFTAQELIAAVRECAKEVDGIPSFGVYIGWARRAAVAKRPGRRPRSQAPFDRVFGSWLRTLIAADLVESDASGSVSWASTGRVVIHKITEEGVHRNLREIAEIVGRSPRTTEYEHHRFRLLSEAAAEGKPRAIISPSGIQQRYPTWDDALVAAGLEPLGGRHTTKQPSSKPYPGPWYDDATLLPLMYEACLDLDWKITQGSWLKWRRKREKLDQEERRFRRIPHWETFIRRYGSLQATVQAAIDWHDAHQSDETPGTSGGTQLSPVECADDPAGS